MGDSGSLKETGRYEKEGRLAHALQDGPGVGKVKERPQATPHRDSHRYTAIDLHHELLV